MKTPTHAEEINGMFCYVFQDGTKTDEFPVELLENFIEKKDLNLSVTGGCSPFDETETLFHEVDKYLDDNWEEVTNMYWKEVLCR